MEEWYDTAEITHIDYPLLASYIHYLMGFVYRLVDKPGLFNEPLYGDGIVQPRFLLGVRLSILAHNLLSYYPVVVYVVLKRFKEYSKPFQAAVVLMFLNFPMYAMIEFSNTQANGFHLALFLLSLDSALDDRFILTTVYFTISIAATHASGPYVFPIAV